MKKLQTTIATLCAAGALTLPVTPAQAAEKTSFDAVTAKLDPNGHLYAYMNTAKVMKQLDQMVESLIAMTEEGGDDSIFNNPLFGPMIGNLVGAIKPAYDESGLSRIDGVGMSSFAVREDLWRSKMYVHRSSPEDEGLIWKILGSEPHELSVLDLAPENTAVLAHSDLDINALLGWIDRISAKMNDGQTLTAEMPGEAKDVLNSYGGEVGFLMTLDPEKQITLPGFMFQMEEDIEMDSFAFALMLRAKDDTLLTMLNDAMSGGLAPPQKTKVGLVTLHSVPMPMPIPIPGLDITPCYFQVDDYMVFTSSTALGKAIIEAKNGKGKLTENDEFKSITKGIDLKGNGISYASTASIEWGGKINELTMGQMPDELKKTFQIYLDYTKTMKGMVSLIKSDKDGVLIETHSNVNLYGEYMVHTFASIGIMVANSMQELNNSGMFEDLNDFGGFDEGPGAFNEGPPPNFSFDDLFSDLMVTMRVNPTSPESEGHSRLEKNSGDLSEMFIFSTGAFSYDEIRIGKTYESVTPKDGSESDDLLLYEGFDYEESRPLIENSDWYKGGSISQRVDNHQVRKGSLHYPGLHTTGNRAFADSSNIMSGIGREIPYSLLEENNGKVFVSFLMQPEVRLNEGIYDGYFVLCFETDAGTEIAFGKGGEGAGETKEEYGSELRGGGKRISSKVKAQIEKPVLIVLEISQSDSSKPNEPELTNNITAPAGKLAIAHWVKGEEVDLSEGVNVVEFWATWCPPCLTSIPHLTAMQKRYKEHGVNIIGISDEPLRTVEPFVKKMGEKMDYIVAIDDAKATSREYMGRYGIGGIPHAFVVKDGTVVWHGHPMNGLDKAIEEALGGVAAKSDADHFGEFYAENTIGEEYQLTTAQVAEIIKREEDRSAVPELYKRIGLDKYTKGTVTLNYFSPNGAPQPGPPPFGIKLKFVSGGYSVEEADFPTPTGGTDKVHHVVAVIEERRAFVNHVFKEGDLIGVGIREMINDTDSKLTGIGINPDGSTYNFTSKDNLSNGLVKGETTYTVDGVVVSKSKSTIQFE